MGEIRVDGPVHRGKGRAFALCSFAMAMAMAALAAARADQRYVAPDGTVIGSRRRRPAGRLRAVNLASGGDEILVEPGR